tara:strand:+ start:293 stop:589 length:297 start_codon:yes stop_codon:yes gene_type:complete
MNTYSINLNTATWETTEALLNLDKTFIGTPNYMGIRYFWSYDYRHYLRDASPYQRKRVHKKWIDEGLCFSAISQKHFNIIGEILKKEVPILEDKKNDS